MRRKGRFTLRLIALVFAATAPFALHIDDLFASPLGVASLALVPPTDDRNTRALIGQAKAVEGDLLEIGGKRVWLYGIDAPEIAQNCQVIVVAWGCGAEAQKMLNALIANRTVTCTMMTRDIAGPLAALCRTESVQLNETMGRLGMALANPREPRAFAAEEQAAARDGVGVWHSRFEKPWKWRAANAK